MTSANKSNPDMCCNTNIWRTIGILLIGMIVGYVLGRFEFEPIDQSVIKKSTEKTTQVEQQEETPTVQEINTDNDPFVGDENAPITIVEFSDYQCPFCYRFYSSIFPDLKKDFIDTGKVKYVFRDYPLNIHPAALSAHLAAECANDQGKYWEMHNYLFDNQSDWSKAEDLNGTLVGYAGTLGLNASTFSECLTSGKYKDEINSDKSEGKQYGVQGTPTLFINGKILRGLPQSYVQFKSLLESELDS